MIRLQTPDHAGSRLHARDLASKLPQGITRQLVVLDCGQLLVATPSFFDEIVKLILEVGNAACLEVINASQRARELLERSAANRGVSARLKIAAGVP